MAMKRLGFSCVFILHNTCFALFCCVEWPDSGHFHLCALGGEQTPYDYLGLHHSGPTGDGSELTWSQVNQMVSVPIVVFNDDFISPL